MEKEKAEAFIKEFGELREKHRMDFISVPMYEPTENGVWQLRVQPQVVAIDIPSPFIPSHDDSQETA